jgi:hypothetical protein
LEGIVLYNIELNGCLNGVHTNNEIAKSKEKKENGITGLYDCFYFDFNLAGTSRVDCIL